MPHTLEEKRANAKRVRENRKAQGLCTICGREATRKNKLTCQTCAADEAKNHSNANTGKKWRARMKAENKCTSCGKGQPDAKSQYCRKCKDRIAGNRREQNSRLRQEILEAYGRRCVCCGEAGQEFLQLDHVNNDGNKQRAAIGTGHNIYKWAKRNNYPKDSLQLLCANCNSAKGKHGECPHVSDSAYILGRFAGMATG